MAKRSQRRPVRYEKDQAGCIWGLISIFDFRHGRSSQKLISDRRHGSRHAAGAGYSKSKLNTLTNVNEKCQSIDDGEERETATADAVTTSVKELMEEEMFSEQDSKKQMNIAEVELEQSNSKHGGHVRKNRKRTNKIRKKSCDTHNCDLGAATNLGPENSCHQVSNQKTLNNLDLEVIMEELCQQIHQKGTSCVKHDLRDSLDMQSNQAYSVFEEKLNAAIKVFINQRFTNGKNLTDDGKTYQSKEFMDALQTLSSNKELFLQHLQDPSSLLVKHIQDLEDARLEKDQNSDSLVRTSLSDEELTHSKPDELVNRKHRNFFRRRSKSQDSISFRGNEKCQPSSRIVILKPGPARLQGNLDTPTNVNTSLQSNYTMENKGQSERIASQFSFTEIKRKLKHAMGKERHGISADSITHRFPCERQNLGESEKGLGGENAGWGSPNRNHFYTERFAKPYSGIKRGDKIGKLRDSETSVVNETLGCPKQGYSNIYVEAKKHLSEMLSNEDENAGLTSRQLPKTLGRILSLPEFNFSPSCSPGRDMDHSFVTAQMRFSPYNNNFHMVNENTWRLKQENHAVHLDLSRQNFESQSGITDESLDDKVQDPNSNPDVSNELNHENSVEEIQSSIRDEMNTEGVVEIVKTTDTVYQEDSKVLDVSCEPGSFSITIDVQNCDTAEVRDEEISSQCLKLDSFEEDQLSSPLPSPSSSSVTKKVEDPEGAIDRTERPSPISVLEPLFTEDDISPASTKSRPVEPAIQPLQIHFEELLSSSSDQGFCMRTCMEDEESTFEYVEAVLLASGLNWDDFLLRWLSSYQLLDPSLFDEVELFSNRSCHEQKLLFDCTDEILEEVCERYFGCFLGLSFVKQTIQPVPKGMDLINEVWKGVEWHLLLQPPPNTLDQLVRKDMEKFGTWMDLRIDTDHIGIDMGEAILEELMEDSILSFVNDSPEGEFSVVPIELNENESIVNL